MGLTSLDRVSKLFVYAAIAVVCALLGLAALVGYASFAA